MSGTLAAAVNRPPPTANLAEVVVVGAQSGQARLRISLRLVLVLSSNEGSAARVSGTLREYEWYCRGRRREHMMMLS